MSSARCGASRRVLARLGLAAASLSAVRSARQVVLPLWGLSIGLDAADDRAGRRHLGRDRLRALLRERSGHGPVRPALGGAARDGADGRWIPRPRRSRMIWMSAAHVVRHVRRRPGRGQWAVERHPAHPRRRCRTRARPGTVPRLVAHAHRCGRGDLAPAGLRQSPRCPPCRSQPASSAESALLGAVAFVRWVPMFVPRA